MSRIENWTYLLSKEVCNHWLNNQEEELPSFEDSITTLGLIGGVEGNQLSQALEQTEPNGTLLQELEKLLQRIQENYSSESNCLEKLFKIESALFNWYYGDNNTQNNSSCLQKLGLKAQVLRVEIKKSFQDFVNSILIKSSPNNGVNYLSQIGAFIFNLNEQYEAERQNYILQENGGKKSYNFLISQIMKSETNEEVNRNYNLGINALFHIYKCQIKLEVTDLATQIIRGLIQDYQLSSESLIQTTSFLNNLQNSLTVKEQKTNLIIALLFEEMYNVKNPDTLKQEVEKILGIPLNRWGSCGYVSLEEVRKILLEKVSVITKDIYQKQIQGLSLSELNQEQDKPCQLLVISN